MGAYELRPMGIGDILDTVFRLYRQRFLVFLLIALAVYVPFGIIMGVFQTMVPAPTRASMRAPVAKHPSPFQPTMYDQSGAASPDVDPQAMLMSSGVGALSLFLFIVVLYPLCTAALTHNISASYLGETLSAGASYGRAASRLLPLLWTQLLAGVAIMIGYVLCIVPGVIFSLWFLLVVPIVVLERSNGSTALGRSRQLMRDNIGKGFLLMLVVGLLTAVINAALGAVVGLIPWPHAVIRSVVGNIIPAILLPIQTAPAILLYYDLRIRKEAFDLQRLSAALATPATT